LLKIFSYVLVDELIGEEDRPWCEWKRGGPLTQNTLSFMLKPFKIKSKDVRIGGIVKKGYEKKYFEDAFKRY
jgi:Protein of unknown function (DUF3631)